MKKLTLLTLALAAAPAAFAQVILDDTHADIGIGYHGGWDMHIHAGEEPNTTEYEPDEAILYLNSNLRTTAGVAAGLLGVGASDQIWRIRTTPTAGALYLGIGTEETGDIFESYTETDARLGALGAPATADWVTLQLKGFSGPGNFGIWSPGDTGPVVWAATANGLDSSDKVLVLDNGHTHYNFAFSQAGLYEVTFEASGFIGGQRVFSGDTVYTFGVEAVPEPGTMAVLGLGAAALLRRRRRA